MKKLFGKALAMAVMMSLFAGNAFAENSVYVFRPNVVDFKQSDGSPMVRVLIDSEAAGKSDAGSLSATDLSFIDYSQSTYPTAAYTKNGISLGNTDTEHMVTLSYMQGLNMGNLGIHNVAAGDITSATSTDAVNGGQLYTALQGYVKNNGTGTNALAIGYRSSAASNYATAIGPNATVYQTAGVAIGNNTAVYGTGGIAIGTTSYDPSDPGNTGIGGQAGKFGVAVGAYAYGWEDSIALGFESAAGKKSEDLRAVAIGYQAKAEQWNSVALGAKSVATEEDSVSIGNDTLKRKIINVAAGENDTDAVNYSQIKADDGNYVKADQTVAENFNALDAQVKTNADDIATLKTDKADKSYVDTELGKKANAADVYTKSDVDTKLGAKADKTYVDTELGKKANAADVYTKSQTDAAIAAAYDDTAIKADIAKKADKATSLAGYGITDAYTKTETDTELAKKADQADLTAEETARINADKNLQSQIDAIGGGSSAGLNELNNKINQTDARLNRVGATAAALAAINYQPMTKGQSQVAIGMGGYNGKKATAIGLAYQFDNRISGSVSGAANGSEHMFNVGFNYLFGQHTAKDIAPMAAGSLSLAEAELKAENSALKNKVADQEARISRLEKIIASLGK